MVMHYSHGVCLLYITYMYFDTYIYIYGSLNPHGVSLWSMHGKTYTTTQWPSPSTNAQCKPEYILSWFIGGFHVSFACYTKYIRTYIHTCVFTMRNSGSAAAVCYCSALCIRLALLWTLCFLNFLSLPERGETVIGAERSYVHKCFVSYAIVFMFKRFYMQSLFMLEGAHVTSHCEMKIC